MNTKNTFNHWNSGRTPSTCWTWWAPPSWPLTPSSPPSTARTTTTITTTTTTTITTTTMQTQTWLWWWWWTWTQTQWEDDWEMIGCKKERWTYLLEFAESKIIQNLNIDKSNYDQHSHHNSHKFKIIETTESQILTIGCGQSLRKLGASTLSCLAQAPGGFQNYQNYFQNYHNW